MKGQRFEEAKKKIEVGTCMKKILVVDDEKPISDIIKFNMAKEGYEVLTAFDGKEALAVFEAESPDILILDLMLPEIDGLEVARTIRKTSNVPIIVLSAKDTEFDKVIGLEIGADDYVAKPFSAVTIMARIKALLRRTQRATVADNTFASEFDVETDHVKINTKTHEAFIDGKQIENLTPKEFDLLMVMAKHQRQVFTREHLLTKIWEDPFYGDERTVDAHIKKLRQKIEAVGPHVIHTVWGVGYKFDDSEL